MIKGWLTQIITKLRELAPDECGKLDFPIGLEVDSSGENSGWVVRLDEKKIDMRSKKEDDAKVTFYVNQNYLRALSINLRTKYWREAFEAKNITANVGDAGQKKKLETLVKAVEKKEAEAAKP
jgi:hypothetical protein